MVQTNTVKGFRYYKRKRRQGVGITLELLHSAQLFVGFKLKELITGICSDKNIFNFSADFIFLYLLGDRKFFNQEIFCSIEHLSLTIGEVFVYTK